MQVERPILECPLNLGYGGCREEHCAWWVEDGKASACAIRAIADNLDAIRIDGLALQGQ